MRRVRPPSAWPAPRPWESGPEDWARPARAGSAGAPAPPWPATHDPRSGPAPPRRRRSWLAPTRCRLGAAPPEAGPAPAPAAAEPGPAGPAPVRVAPAPARPGSVALLRSTQWTRWPRWTRPAWRWQAAPAPRDTARRAERARAPPRSG